MYTSNMKRVLANLDEIQNINQAIYNLERNLENPVICMKEQNIPLLEIVDYEPTYAKVGCSFYHNRKIVHLGKDFNQKIVDLLILRRKELIDVCKAQGATISFEFERFPHEYEKDCNRP